MAAFADLLTPLVGWPVSAEAVEAWEADSVPPGDLLVAVDSVASGERPAEPVLGSIPPSFPAEALSGWWVTTFVFRSGSAVRRHVDVARIEAEVGQLMRITNHPPQPRSEGRASPFCNDLDAQLINRHVVGHWKNSTDRRYFGAFQLSVLPGETVMAGHYTGFGSDVEVSTGPWRWVRLDEDSAADADLSTVVLRDPVELGERIENHTPYGPALTLADIRQEQS